MICFVCSAVLGTVELLIDHYKCYHPACSNFECECGRMFGNRNAFKVHLSQCFPNYAFEESNLTIISSNNDSSFVDEGFDEPMPSNSSCVDIDLESIATETYDVTNLSDFLSFQKNLTKSALLYVAHLYAQPAIPRSLVQTIIDGHKKLISSDFLSALQLKVKNLLQMTPCDASVVNEVMAMFDAISNMFQNLDTEALRLQAFKSTGAYIAPKPFNINPTSNELEVVNEQEIFDDVVIQPDMLTGHFVPLDIVLKGFLEIPNVLDQILSYMKYLSTENTVMENVTQGHLWKSVILPKFKDKIVLPLNVYFDEFEPDNTLGSHSGVHKMGPVYCEIACLPPEFQGSLENKFLALMFHATDRGIGNKEVFRPLLNILQFLENEGISVVLPSGIVYQVYFALAVFIGDNAGLHGVLGFVEGFTANFPCRFCRADKNTIQRQVNLDVSLLRNHCNYEEDLLISDESLTGVKENCILNVLKSFHVIDNVYADIMHDMLEGVCGYSLSVIIAHLIRNNYFDYDTLNERVQCFFYGEIEGGNKPPLITASHVEEGLKFSASEMLCFVRYFGLMVGDLVPPDECVWEFFVQLQCIVDYVCAPSITDCELIILRDHILKHHKMYQDFFHQSLKPKHHYMLHYVDIIRMIGPLSRVWCMRWESKHRESKQYSNVSCNRINLPLSLSIKHQLIVCCRFLIQKGLERDVQYSLLDTISLKDFSDFKLFAHVVPSHAKRFSRAKWVIVNGVKYNIGMVIVSALGEYFPVFSTINAIVLQDKNVWFIVKDLCVTKFDEHLHAYEVEVRPTCNWKFISLCDLVSHLPSSVRVLNNRNFVSFRYIL